jgi:hypothetical protein
MEKADPPPTSSNCDIFGNWMVKLKQEQQPVQTPEPVQIQESVQVGEQQ